MVLYVKFRIENVDFQCMHVPAVHPSINNSLPPLMSAPPIPRSGRCNYFRRDRAKCHQDFSKSHRVTSRALPFFSPSHQLPLSINSARRLSSAISLQTISPRRRGLELLQGSRSQTAQRGLHANENSRTFLTETVSDESRTATSGGGGCTSSLMRLYWPLAELRQRVREELKGEKHTEPNQK